MTGRPQSYFCYCLSEFERALDLNVLQAIWEDFGAQQHASAHQQIHFVVCKESNATANMHISVRRFSNNVVTIPLEREEARRAILNETAGSYLQSKVLAWMDNHRLFAAPWPAVREGEFFGREEELARIKANVKNAQSFHLIGLRRMGKTSLIKHLESIGAFRNMLYAYINIDGHLARSAFNDAIDQLLRQWRETLQRRHPHLMETLETQLSSSASPLDHLSQFLDALQRLPNESPMGLRCLAVFDDVNILFGERNNTPDTLWNCGASETLRMLRTHPLVTMILTMHDSQTPDRIEDEYSGSGGLGKYDTISVQPLKYAECNRMITYIGGIINMVFDDVSLGKIYAETGGHPQWTRILCDTIINTRRKQLEQIIVTPEHVEDAAQRFLSSHERFIREPLNALNNKEKQVQDELAASDHPLKLEEFSAPINRQTLNALFNYGLIEQTESGAYRLRMGLVTRYLRAKWEKIC